MSSSPVEARIYPDEARHERIQGTVVLRAVINKTGDVVDLEVVDGPVELVPSAVTAVRQWKYRPYLLQGRPVEVTTQITVNYALHKLGVGRPPALRSRSAGAEAQLIYRDCWHA